MSTNIVPLKAGGQILPIIPQSIEEIFRLAQGIAASNLAPQGMRTPEQIMVAIMTGLELGLPPMFAIQKIAVINGRPSIWGDAVPALLWARGFKLREWMAGEDEKLTAHCEVTRPDGDKIARAFSVANARKAGLWGKSGPWSQHPERMLQMRARGFCCRDGASDVLTGLYIAEELQEPPRDVTPAKAAVLEVPDDIQPQTMVLAAPDADEPLADADGFLFKLEEDIALCTSVEELSEIEAHNRDMIARLPKAQKTKAEKMLKDAAE